MWKDGRRKEGWEEQGMMGGAGNDGRRREGWEEKGSKEGWEEKGSMEGWEEKGSMEGWVEEKGRYVKTQGIGRQGGEWHNRKRCRKNSILVFNQNIQI